MLNIMRFYYKNFIVLIVVTWFSLALGGGEAKDEKVSTSVGSYKTRTLSANPNYSAKYKRPIKGDPVDMAYDFFQLNKETLGIKDPRGELMVGRVDRHPVGAMVLFKQQYNGVTIADSDIRAFFTREGELRDVQGDYYYEINLATTPSIDPATAENLALKDLGYPKDAKIVKTEQYFTRLNIWRDNNGKLRLIWVLWVKQEIPAHSWRYYIDAHDGTVLYKLDIIRR